MKNALYCTFAALALAGCAAMSQGTAGTSKEMKIAFDVTNGNPNALMLQLATIDLTRKQLIEQGITPRIVVTFRGDASFYTQSKLAVVKESDRADALTIKAKLRELRKASGVEGFEQCNVPLAARKLNPAELMEEVKLVPNGWIALAGYQEKGYSYIVP
jgi:intracellular sulfur oxidation DsrE/DsrF family protein